MWISLKFKLKNWSSNILNKVMNFAILTAILLICIILSIIVSIIISGSRSTGVGYGIIGGISLGNLIFTLIIKGRLIHKIMFWLLSTVIMLGLNYLLLNTLPFDNTTILIVLCYFLPLFISREFVNLLYSMLKIDFRGDYVFGNML